MQKKHKINNFVKLGTKKGVASLYVVIFTTILLGIVTLSFIRIVISETGQTTNIDLSQSAYDSAQAGVEDAKVALLRYHDCLSGRSVASNCTSIINKMQAAIRDNSCDAPKQVLDRPGTGEVIIQETTGGGSGNGGTDTNNSSELLQAYTCVKIAEELDDYRSTLSSSSRTRIVPLRSINDSGSGGDGIKALRKIVIGWYSQVNHTSGSTRFISSGDKFLFPALTGSNTPKPPVISFQLIQAPSEFIPNEDFNVPSGNQTNRAEVFLYPVSGGGTNSISAADFAKTANKMPDGSGSNRVYKIQCSTSSEIGNDKEFYCQATINIPPTIGGHSKRSRNATFVKVGLPYGTPTTDFSIQMQKEDGNLIKFYGVQTSIDSTGRANDLFRRIEERVELVDVYYPYPEFTIQLDDNSGGSEALSKNFYSTRTCWHSTDDSNNVGYQSTECDDNNK